MIEGIPSNPLQGDHVIRDMPPLFNTTQYMHGTVIFTHLMRHNVHRIVLFIGPTERCR